MNLAVAKRPRALSRWTAASFILCLAAFFVFYALNAGPDMSWDLRNYHFYAGYMALTGNGEHNLWPAQIQSWFNPLLDAFTVALIFVFPPRGVAVMFVVLQALSLCLLYHVAHLTLLAVLQKAHVILFVFCCVAIGATGPMVLDQLGTGFGDVLTAVPVLAALALCAQTVVTTDALRGLSQKIGLAGLLLGLSCGLKPTNGIYAPGLALIVMFAESLNAPRTLPHGLFRLFVLGSAAALGFAITDGRWAWHLWQQTGNPVFPFLNSVFRSPLLLATSQSFDPRFAPHSLLAFLAFPFEAAWGQSPGSLVFYRDPRFAAVIGLTAVLLGLRRPIPRLLALLLVFFFTSYVFWLLAFGVERYIAGLELLSGVLIVSLLAVLFDNRLRLQGVLIGTVIVVLATIVPAKTTSGERGDWKYVGPEGNWLNVRIPAELTDSKALYLLMGDAPLSFLVPFFPPDNAFVGMNGNLLAMASPSMENLKRRAIEDYVGPILTLSDGPLVAQDRAYLKLFGLLPTASCSWIYSATNLVQVCALQKSDVNGRRPR